MHIYAFFPKHMVCVINRPT